MAATSSTAAANTPTLDLPPSDFVLEAERTVEAPASRAAGRTVDAPVAAGLTGGGGGGGGSGSGRSTGPVSARGSRILPAGAAGRASAGMYSVGSTGGSLTCSGVGAAATSCGTTKRYGPTATATPGARRTVGTREPPTQIPFWLSRSTSV